MASIKKIRGKAGLSFKITVSSGRDGNYKQIRHFMTWRPEKQMTELQAEKAVQRVAMDFERSIERGFAIDDKKRFSEYAEYVIDLKERNGAAPNSIENLRKYLKRANEAFGNKRIAEITPRHLNEFYKIIEKEPRRLKPAIARAKIDVRERIRGKESKVAFCRRAGLAPGTFDRFAAGEKIRLENADKIAKALQMSPQDVFAVEEAPEEKAEGTLLKMHTLFSVVFAQAEREFILPYNPAEKATPPKGREARETRCLQPDELRQILKCAESEPIQWRTLLHLFAVTGCRRGELLALKWENVDLNKGLLYINASLSYLPKKGLYVGKTKTKKARTVVIPSETIELLQKYRTWQTVNRLSVGDLWSEGGFVFTRYNGLPLYPMTVNTRLNEFSIKYGLPHLHPHMFRHTAASIMLSSGVDVVTTAKMLGHSPATALNVYAHEIEEAKRNAAESVAGIILRENTLKNKKNACNFE